ncbi:MAG: V-type ATP synthase subunit F [Deltaproteobacteria bacterium]|nr:V-type ATP synthase subunit F [Deltaproteobacteria bacterium]
MAVIADPDTVLAFRLAGVEGRAAHHATALAALIERLRLKETGLMLITEALFDENRELLEKTLLEPGGPLILEIPGVQGADAPQEQDHRLDCRASREIERCRSGERWNFYAKPLAEEGRKEAERDPFTSQDGCRHHHRCRSGCRQTKTYQDGDSLIRESARPLLKLKRIVDSGRT